MKFDPTPRKNIFGEGCFIKSSENLLYFTEEFDLAGVNWGAPAGISAPYFLHLLQDGKNARARKNELEADPIFNPNPHSMDEFWYPLFDHGNMWRQRSGEYHLYRPAVWKLEKDHRQFSEHEREIWISGFH